MSEQSTSHSFPEDANQSDFNGIDSLASYDAAYTQSLIVKPGNDNDTTISRKVKGIGSQHGNSENLEEELVGGYFQKILQSFEKSMESILIRLIQLCAYHQTGRFGILEHIEDIVLRSSLVGRLFPNSSAASNICFPEEMFHISMILYPARRKKWHYYLFDKLSSNALMVPGGITPIFGLHALPSGHIVKTELSLSIGIQQYSIRVNHFADVFSTLLLEEVNRLIGSENLLKRSLILIKAYIKHELPRFSYIPHNELARIFSGESMLIMVIGLFAQFRDEIKSPSSLLLTFLRKFSVLDWNRNRITVYGFEEKHAEKFTSISPQDSSMVSGGIKEIVRRLKARYQACHAAEIGRATQSSTDGETTPYSLSPMNPQSPLVIEDPFLPERNVIPHPSYRTLFGKSSDEGQLLSQAFRSGFQYLVNESQSKEGNPLPGISFYLNKWHQFDDNFPKLPVNPSFDILETPKKLVDDLASDVELVVGAVLDGDSLTRASAHIITCANKPLRVADVGSILRAELENPQLGAFIKSSFGGFKRMVLSFPGAVQLGDDHPSNPLVYLYSKSTANKSIWNMFSPLSSTTTINSDSVESTMSSQGSHHFFNHEVEYDLAAFDDLESVHTESVAGSEDVYSQDATVFGGFGRMNLTQPSPVMHHHVGTAQSTTQSPPPDLQTSPNIAPTGPQEQYPKSWRPSRLEIQSSPRVSLYYQPSPSMTSTSTTSLPRDNLVLPNSAYNPESAGVSPFGHDSPSGYLPGEGIAMAAGVRGLLPPSGRDVQGPYPVTSGVAHMNVPRRDPINRSPGQSSSSRITAASGATVVDPMTGNKVFNPVKPQVWVPGKFAGKKSPVTSTQSLPPQSSSVFGFESPVAYGDIHRQTASSAALNSMNSGVVGGPMGSAFFQQASFPTSSPGMASFAPNHMQMHRSTHDPRGKAPSGLFPNQQPLDDVSMMNSSFFSAFNDTNNAVSQNSNSSYSDGMIGGLDMAGQGSGGAGGAGVSGVFGTSSSTGMNRSSYF